MNEIPDHILSRFSPAIVEGYKRYKDVDFARNPPDANSRYVTRKQKHIDILSSFAYAIPLVLILLLAAFEQLFPLTYAAATAALWLFIFIVFSVFELILLRIYRHFRARIKQY